MEYIWENARQYLLSLKEAGGFTAEEIATMSGVPAATVRNILSGKTAKNAGFYTIAKMVAALNGSLDELVSSEKKKEIEINSIVSLKETSEMRLTDIINSYESRLEDVKTLCELRIADIQKCCDMRLADARKNFEERLEDYRRLITKQ